MKKVFQSFILSLAALAFSACNNSNQNKPDEPASNPLIGMWVNNVANEGFVGGYTEFGKDGVVTCYSLGAGVAKYEEGYIQALKETSWKEDYAMKYTYEKQTQAIWVSDIKAGTIEKLSNDEFVLPNSNSYISSGTYRRVKGFKTVESINVLGTSIQYNGGYKPVIDYNNNTVNGFKFDNAEKQCWNYTVYTTYLGITWSQDDWFWGTEFELVAALEEKMYVVAQNDGSTTKAKYKYVIEVGADQDRCEELSDRAN